MKVKKEKSRPPFKLQLGASGLLIVNSCVLLGLRNKDDAALPGLWCTPGGGVEPGESIDVALVREFQEEVGLAVQPMNLCPTFVGERFNLEKNRYTVLVFKRVTYAGLHKSPVAGDGFSEVAWFTHSELLPLREKITPLTVNALEHFGML